MKRADIQTAIAEAQRLKSLASDHYRNARRLARLLVHAEDELRRMKKERS